MVLSLKPRLQLVPKKKQKQKQHWLHYKDLALMWVAKVDSRQMVLLLQRRKYCFINKCSRVTIKTYFLSLSLHNARKNRKAYTIRHYSQACVWQLNSIYSLLERNRE
eukprot:m.81653 g.81653  ORF g.81653 m.81653 type:complete len:107 (+) comp36241_c0_seq3:2843-3163(+)